MLSRIVITRSGRHFRGRYPSRKLGRMVAFESLIERDVIQLLEFSPGVINFQEQPTQLFYGDDDRLSEYFPDFAAHLSSGQVIHIEVKPSKKLRKPEISRKLAAIATHYESHRDERFLVITEIEARKEPLYSNLKLLGPVRAKARRLPELPLHYGQSGFLFSDLETQLGRLELLRLVACGALLCDLTKPLKGQLLFSSSKEASYDSLYI